MLIVIISFRTVFRNNITCTGRRMDLLVLITWPGILVHQLLSGIPSPLSFHSWQPDCFVPHPILSPVSVPVLPKILFTARSAIVSTLLELISLHIFISTAVYWTTRLVNHMSGRICLIRQKFSWKMLFLDYRTQLKMRVMKVL